MKNGLALGLTCLFAAQAAPAQSCANLTAVGGFRTDKVSGNGDVVGESTSRPAVPNSQGHLCLAGSIGRFVGPGQIQNSGQSAAFSLAVDLAALPTPTGPVAVQAGETWHFQAWFRDANPNATSNFTDAVSVRFR